jgi:rRNA-processing protein FCF1
MPLHIEDLTSEVTVIDGESMLSEAQKEMLVQIVIRRLADKAREAERKARATELRRQAAEPLEVRQRG